MHPQKQNKTKENKEFTNQPNGGTLLTEEHPVVLRVWPPPLLRREAHDFPG